MVGGNRVGIEWIGVVQAGVVHAGPTVETRLRWPRRLGQRRFSRHIGKRAVVRFDNDTSTAFAPCGIGRNHRRIGVNGVGRRLPGLIHSFIDSLSRATALHRFGRLLIKQLGLDRASSGIDVCGIGVCAHFRHRHGIWIDIHSWSSIEAASAAGWASKEITGSTGWPALGGKARSSGGN